MKWNELADEAQVQLLEDLMFLPDDALEPGVLYSRNEILDLLEVAYPAGSIFTFDLVEELLYDKDGGVLAQVPDIKQEMQDRFKVL